MENGAKVAIACFFIGVVAVPVMRFSHIWFMHLGRKYLRIPMNGGVLEFLWTIAALAIAVGVVFVPPIVLSNAFVHPAGLDPREVVFAPLSAGIVAAWLLQMMLGKNRRH